MFVLEDLDSDGGDDSVRAMAGESIADVDGAALAARD